jgi:thiamine kinase-like enzyme
MGEMMKDTLPPSKEHLRKFYVDKTDGRVRKFIANNGESYFNTDYVINTKEYPSMRSLLKRVDYNSLLTNPFYEKFHGDLQFDNVVYTKSEQKFTFIDWRDSFGTNTEYGDVYYDLAKLYGGCIIPYNKMKNEDNISFEQGMHTVSYSYDVPENLTKFKTYYENWIVENGYDLEKVKLITSLIFLNMSPLHDEKFSKMLWFKSTEMLYECLNK